MEESESKWGLTTVLFLMMGLFCLLNLYLQWNADIRPLLQLHTLAMGLAMGSAGSLTVLLPSP